MAIVDPGDDGLERAEESASANALNYVNLNLKNLRLRTRFPVADALTAASCTRTVEGASTLILTFDDKDLGLLRTGEFDINEDGGLDPLEVTLDTLVWRLVKVETNYGPDASEVKLTFEEQTIALLEAHDAHIVQSRANKTRAEFAHRLVKEVKTKRLAFYSPEEHFQQAIAKPAKDNKSRDAQRKPGFADGVTLKIKGVTADGEQLSNIEDALIAADEENAKGRARLALIVAGIGESSFRRSATQPRTRAHGVYQLIPATAAATGLDPEDTQATARHFLVHGYYRYGGAIALARENPGMTVGEIVSKVEGSDAGGSFYQAYAAEGRKIVAAWDGTTDDGGGTPTDRTVIKAYQFTRGLPGKRENSWQTLQRLAEEVGWRCFVVGGVVYFISEEQLFMSRVRAELSIDFPGLVNISADWDAGKTIAEAKITIDADRWSFPPGSIIALRDLGPFNGRWLVSTIDRPDLFDPQTEITLTKPIARKREPAADTIQVPRHPNSKASTADPESEQNGGTGNGPAEDARGVKASSTASARLRKWKNPDGSILWVCEWMFPQLEHAKKTGKWSGVITEGWRSRDTEEIYWDRYGHDPGLAARPGTSNHGWTIHPRGAIDTADPAGLERGLRSWDGHPAAMKGNGVALPRDIVHFSSDGQ